MDMIHPQVQILLDGKADGMDDLGLITLTISFSATPNEDVQVFARVDN
jgi:hypothetical protein